jgi:hypothetical protein
MIEHLLRKSSHNVISLYLLTSWKETIKSGVDVPLVQINGKNVRSLFVSAQLALLVLKNMAYRLFQGANQFDRNRMV